MTTVYTVADVRAKLVDRIAKDGWRGTATAFGCSPQYLQQVTSGEKPPGPAILDGLGLAKGYVDAPAESSGKPLLAPTSERL